ncbi:TPA: hypothetical protein MHT93_21960 [Klebsiella pneumoniae]|uniref:conjugal transfer nickase/helicase domain-containing protein n=1 Tax=Klebsiella pneumoniae TaxID=573 RepID=UPI000DF0D734|nr:DNA-binding domain-containing protein [Klebsiella variicola]MDS0125224.1 DNA-binding domain-containing protein [Klebsiella pneumoniae]HBX2587650.1 hypothetical protein [Klebsiella pneumoniae]HEE1311155.1 DNA-binding domain-containing protein [Klebsiella pneumoniae]HEE1373199.1 DNA-binding domain-containing protein [Klebsiella pneumoniae]
MRLSKAFSFDNVHQLNSQPKADLVLELHRQGKEGINIWHCEVKGSRNTRKVKGYFLENPFHTVW